jgi:hypothetical protein
MGKQILPFRERFFDMVVLVCDSLSLDSTKEFFLRSIFIACGGERWERGHQADPIERQQDATNALISAQAHRNRKLGIVGTLRTD